VDGVPLMRLVYKARRVPHGKYRGKTVQNTQKRQKVAVCTWQEVYTESSENDLHPDYSRSYTQGMSKNTPLKKEVRKIPKNFRLFAEDVRRLKLGAEKMGVPAAIYLQFALREKFKEDGIE
jgi:hypothetical protein